MHTCACTCIYIVEGNQRDHHIKVTLILKKEVHCIISDSLIIIILIIIIGLEEFEHIQSASDDTSSLGGVVNRRRGGGGGAQGTSTEGTGESNYKLINS